MGCNALILLDTHVLVWALEGDRRLKGPARETIEAAALNNDGIAISAISVWEIAMLTERGRLVLSRDVVDWIDFVVSAARMTLLPLEPGIAIACNRLPGTFHADPADRIIVGTARRHGLPLLTADRKIIEYAEAGHLTAIDAGRQ